MVPPSRHPPKVLFVHNGIPYDAHIQHLKDAGLDVSQAHAAEAVTTATTLQPDIVVLDFGCDGETTRQFKENPTTRHIPVIALVEMLKQ
jgi:CheY-like chemotaxis protein